MLLRCVYFVVRLGSTNKRGGVHGRVFPHDACLESFFWNTFVHFFTGLFVDFLKSMMRSNIF